MHLPQFTFIQQNIIILNWKNENTANAMRFPLFEVRKSYDIQLTITFGR